MMKKRLLAFPLCVLMVLLLLLPAAYAGDADTGQMTVENLKYVNGEFSCDVKLSGAPTAGRVFAVLHAQSGQVRDIQRYAAQESVAVSVPNAEETDSVRLLWVDANNMPVAECPGQQMSDIFEIMLSDAMRDMNMSSGIGSVAASGGDNRLLVSCETPPDWRSYEGLMTVIPGPDQLYVLQFDNPTHAKVCKEELEKLPSIRYVEFDSVMIIEDVEAKTLAGREPPQKGNFPYSWGAKRSGIYQYAQELKTKNINREIVVAVVDSGVDQHHEFLAGRLLPGHSSIPFFGPQDEHGHGTHVTGIIADCTREIKNVKILPVRVLDKFGNTSALIISNGIRHAANHGANVINISLGYSEHKHVIDEAIQYALSKNITVVVAACNANADAKEFCPAHMEPCITVAAVDGDEDSKTELRRWGRSNYGNMVDIAAAGGEVYSSLPNNKYDHDSGTSMAAPHVAAAAALLKYEHPEYTPTQISDALKNAAEPLNSTRPIGGFLNMLPFIEKTVTVTFNANGGTGTMQPLPATVGKPVTLSANTFTRKDYDFVGWNTKADGTGTSYGDKAQFTASADTTLYAQWKQTLIEEIGAYALLYTDGTLDFRGSNAPAPGKEVEKSYKVPMTDVLQYAAWYDDRASVKRVTFSAAMQPYSTAQWFYGFANLTEISGLDKLDTSQTTDMSQMFARCSALTKLDLSALDTSSVTKMKSMFAGCKNLTELDLTGWNTAKVTDMSDMFNGCASLKKVYASDSFAPGQGVMTPFDFSTPINTNTTVYADWAKGPDSGLVVGSGTVDVGDTGAIIPITIEKRGNIGASVLQFDVVFPDELILVRKPEIGTLFADMGLNRDILRSPYTVSLGDDTATIDTTAEGVLVTLYFKLRPGAAPGTYNITIQEQDNYNAAFDPVTFGVTDGYITVRADGSGLVVGTGTAIAGDDDTIIPVTIEKKGAIGASMLQFDVVFPDALILTAKPEIGTLFADTGLNLDTLTSPYTVSLGSDTATTNVTKEGVLVTLYFKVKPGTAAGRYDITLQSQDNYSVNLDSVTFPVTPGHITVSSGASLMAGDDGSLVVGSGTVNAGDADTLIPITIDKKGFAGVAAMQFDVVFPDALILTAKPTVGKLLADTGLNLDIFTSPYTVSLGSDTATEDVTDEGNLVTLYFKVKPGTAPGTYAIRVQGQDNYNANFDSVTFDVTSGAVTVLPNGETVVVTFDANGGTPATTQVTIGKGEKVAPPTVYPTRSGYSFNGWFTSGAGKSLNSVGMFNNCTAIEGQQGTKYDPAHTDITYARIDGGTQKPGYFWQK